MSVKKTLIFLAILVLLGSYYYLVEVRMAAKKQATEEVAKKIFQIQEQDIQEIIVKRADQEIVLQKQDTVWNVIQPVKASSDAQNVQRLLTGFVETEQDQIIAEKPSDVKEFGLDQPDVVVSVKTTQGTPGLQLSIGKATPTVSGYYARIGDKPAVITVSANVKTNLDKTLYDLRAKTILDFDPAQIKQVAFTIRNAGGATQDIKLEQTEDHWKIVGPKAYNADQTKMVAFLSNVKSSQIKEFIEENPTNLAQYGLEPPLNTLALVIGQDNTRKTLLLGNANPNKDGVYAKLETAGNVFLVPTTLLEQFPKKPNDLRDRTLLTLNETAIQKIELKAAGESVVLEKILPTGGEQGTQAEQWQGTQPAEFKADREKIQAMLSAAKELKIEQFVTDEPGDLSLYGLNPPQITVNFWEKDQANPRQLLLGNADIEKTGIYAKLGDQDSLVLVKSDVLNQFKKTAFDLRYKKILSFASEPIKKIQIAYREKTVVIEKDGDIWKTTQPEKQAWESYKINNLMYDLQNLEFTEEIATPGEDVSQYRLQEPQVQLTLWEKEGKEVFTLLIGKKIEGKDVLYAKTKAGNSIYAIDPAFLDELPKEEKRQAQ
jgi:hypothetical protein